MLVAFDASFFLSTFWSSFIFFTSLAHFLDLLQSNHIDIEPMRSQREMRDSSFIVESQHESSTCCDSILVFTIIFKRRVFASQCIFSSILDICCHIDASFHEKALFCSTNLNIETLKISMLSSHKSALFFVKTCRIIENRFVRFCNLRIDVWFNLRHWKSLFESFKQRIAKKASEITSLKKLVCNNDNHSFQ